MATRTMSSTAVVILALLAGTQAAGIHQGNQIISTNYPNNYPHNEHTVQTLTVEAGYGMMLEIKEFQIEADEECSYDYMLVCDGLGKCGPRLCGTNIPKPITLLTSNATVVFHSDDSESMKGFLLTFHKVKLANCTGYEFLCYNGEGCINRSYICDGKTDCSDGSDELPSFCKYPWFPCADGVKRPSVIKCDGSPDCLDGSDESEKSCAGNCTSSEFACADGKQCIPDIFKCDGSRRINVMDYDELRRSCRDGSDESPSLCGNCTEYESLCTDGEKCIGSGQLCDGRIDCGDESDELPCMYRNCTSDEFLCANGIQCIPASLICNGISTCRDGSDEHTTVCGDCASSQFACTDGLQCIPAGWRCDGGYPDCKDGSDEVEACNESEESPDINEPERLDK